MKITYLLQHVIPARAGQSIPLRELEIGEVVFSHHTGNYHKRDEKYFYSSIDGLYWKKDHWNYEKVMNVAGAYTIKGIVQETYL